MMKNALEQASYIWTAPFEKGMDFYRIFRKVFSWRPEGEERVMLEIAADSTFAAFVNGRRCPISQVADFPEDRTFSTFDVTAFLVPGENVIAVEVHYIGDGFLTYQPGTPFLKAVIYEGEKLLAKTDGSWKCSASQEFVSGLCCKVTSQLGFTFAYDARRALPWKELSFDDSGWNNAGIYEGCVPWKKMSPRTVPQLLELPSPCVQIVQAGYLRRGCEGETFAETCFRDYFEPRRHEEIFSSSDTSQYSDGMARRKQSLNPEHDFCFRFSAIPADASANGYYVILDLGKESVGFLTLKVDAPGGTVIDLCHGEHLDDGRVRSLIGGRNFADRFICCDGLNEFTYVHRRVGGRYIELHITNSGGGEVGLYYAGVVPLELPLPQSGTFVSEDHFLKRLNRLSADTLKLCMHEHYEDCPWREQGLYAYDSRNQILYGYYVWGNYDFAASSIDLLGKSYDGERYLALTAPGEHTLTIPVFTLVWISEIYEHWLYSGSPLLFERWGTQVDRILDRALAEKDPVTGGLYHPGDGKHIWNFCEWNGSLSRLEEYPQAPYNIYLCEALLAAAKLHDFSGNGARAAFLRDAAARLGEALEKAFWDPACSCYGALLPGKDELAYEHVQAIMLANSLVPEEKRETLLDLFYSKRLRGIDLSALYYLVAAMMKNGPRARRFLVKYLREIFEPVVFSDATSLWETRQAGDDFCGAGSLCHAWSSVMPYFCGHCLLGVTPLEPAFRRFAVKPYCGDLTHASGEVPTPLGMIRVSWERTGGSLSVKVEHPSGTTPVLEQYEECPVTRFESFSR